MVPIEILTSRLIHAPFWRNAQLLQTDGRTDGLAEASTGLVSKRWRETLSAFRLKIETARHQNRKYLTAAWLFLAQAPNVRSFLPISNECESNACRQISRITTRKTSFDRYSANRKKDRQSHKWLQSIAPSHTKSSPIPSSHHDPNETEQKNNCLLHY